MEYILTFILRFILHFVFLWGLGLVVWPIIQSDVRRTGRSLNQKARLRVLKASTYIENKQKSFRVYRHIDQLLYLVKDNYEPGITFVRFFLVVAALFLAMLTISLLSMGELPSHLQFSNPFEKGISVADGGSSQLFWFPIVISTLVASVPYFRLRYLYSKKSTQASYDLMEVVKLLSRYSHLNIERSIYAAAEIISPANVLKRPLAILSVAVMSYQNEKELEYEVRRFSQAIGTTFAVSFASDLLYLKRDGSHLFRDSMYELGKRMEEQHSTILSMKNSTRDAIAIGSYGNIAVLVIMVAGMMKALKPSVYLQMQLQTKAGVSFLTIIIIGIFISLIISSILSKPKLDYR